ncbi:MAG: thiopurine S-methyltransferase [Candidatus Contendobacter sp.]|nr:thiopurine S-methyltransferase [Candidatus Contendobacter sp.]MDG4556409.1 thiopurine S-methyltransferase [Candidatus Contendobacter sp.]
MQPSFWHERWERAEIGFHQHDVNVHLKRFWDRLESPAGQRVFVPLCGKSLDLLWLAGEGHPVTGVELSPLAVEAFFAENELSPCRGRDGAFEVWEVDEVRILLGDFFALEPRHVADCAGVYDRAALIALPPAMRERYARHLDAILPPKTRMLLVTMEYDQSVSPGPPFAVDEAEVRALYEATHEVELLHTRDALAGESRWRERGLTWLLEKVYRLTHRLDAPPTTGH